MRYYKYGHLKGNQCNCNTYSNYDCNCKCGFEKVLYIIKHLQDNDKISEIDVDYDNNSITDATIENSSYCELPLFLYTENDTNISIYISICSINYITINTTENIDYEILNEYDTPISLCANKDNNCCKNDIISYLKNKYISGENVMINENIYGKVIAMDYDIVWIKNNTTYYAMSLCQIHSFKL